MVEYIGAVAAIPQLAKYSYAAVTSIPDLKRRLSKAPDTLRHWQDDATLLISLTESLLLRPDLVHRIPPDILDRINDDAKEFQNALDTVSSATSTGTIGKLKANIGILRKERQFRQTLATAAQRSSVISCHLLVSHHLGNPTRSEALTPPSSITLVTDLSTPRPLADVIAQFTVNVHVENNECIGQMVPLQELSEKLNIFDKPVVAITGPRGIGKTHLVRHYLALEQTSTTKTSVYWIDASPKKVSSPEQGVLQIQKLPGESDVFESQDLKTLLSWLSSEDSGPWFLIFDNVNLNFLHYRHLVENVSQNPNGRVLFTTTSRTMAFRMVDPSCVLELSGMRPVDAIDLLVNGTVSTNERKEAPALAQFLGCFPAPIVHVNAYMRATTTSLGDLLSLLHQDADVLLSILGVQVEAPVHHYISRASIDFEDKTEAALTLFSLAYLDYSCIDLQLILHLADTANKRKGFSDLESEYLLRPNEANSVWRMSDFHANLLRAHLVSSPYRLQIITNSLLVAHSLNTARTRNTGESSSDQRIRHGCCALGNIMRFTTVGEVSLDFLSVAIALSIRVCHHLINAGNAHEAVNITEQFLAWGQLPLSSSSPSIHILHAKLGTAFYSLALYEKSLSITRNSLYAQCQISENSIDTLHTLNNMGLIHQAQNEFVKAEGYHRKTLELKQRTFQTQHTEILITLNNLGLALQSQKRFEEAEQLYRYVLRGRKRQLPATHADIFTSMSNLGVVLQLQGCLDESRKLHEAALAGRQRILGPIHPETLKSKGNLALIYGRQSQHDRAIQTLHEISAAYKQILGPSHPETIKSLRNLAIFLHRQARLAEAEDVLAEAVEMLEERYGKGHRETFGTLQYLGLLLHLQGKQGEALEVVRALYDRRKDELGLQHPDTKCSRDHLEELELALDRVEDQEDFVIVSRI